MLNGLTDGLSACIKNLFRIIQPLNIQPEGVDYVNDCLFAKSYFPSGHHGLFSSEKGVAVGTLVAQRPPHRSGLVVLLHSALASGDDAKA